MGSNMSWFIVLMRDIWVWSLHELWAAMVDRVFGLKLIVGRI